MTISIDGWKVPGYNIKVNAGVKIAGEDESGNGSLDLSSDNGVKSAVLTVSAKVPHNKLDQLTELIDKSKALDENGARIVYTVNCKVATAYKIRKAKFDGEIKSHEDETLRMWSVSFNLLEVKSKSEREQQQIDANAASNATSQANSGHESIQQQFEKAEGP